MMNMSYLHALTIFISSCIINIIKCLYPNFKYKAVQILINNSRRSCVKKNSLNFGITLLLILVASILLASKPSNLDEEIITPLQDYHVWYTNDPLEVDDYFTDGRANFAADSLDPTHQRFLDLGFKAPYFSESPKSVYIYDSDDTGGANYCEISLDSPGLRDDDEPCIRLTTSHELFHHVEYAYIAHGSSSCGGCGTSWGKYTCEGTARLMQDKVFADLDADAGCITYQGETNVYLSNPNISLNDLSYKACFFWNYLTEQYGTTTAEPERGVDVIVDFWERAENSDSVDPWGVFNDLVEDISGNSLSNVFRDFCITNVTKDYDTSLLSDGSKYSVIDTTPMNQVANAIANADGSVKSNSVKSWASKYYVCYPPHGDCTGVGYKFTADNNLKYAVISIKDGKVVDIYKGSGTNYVKTIISTGVNPIDELWAVVMGNSDSSDFDYVCAAGNVDVNIITPNSIDKAYVGENGDEGHFLVWVDVIGLDALSEGGSVMGLETTDFEVLVGNEPATIMTGGYVSGNYMLACHAPTQTSSDVEYNLTVKICDKFLSVEEQAIVYQDVVNDKILLVDASGSMTEPASNPKIAAAKSAAKYFVLGSPDKDRLGLVRFEGNDHEIDEDAILIKELKEIEGNRPAYSTAIDSITPSDPPGVLTSIGDGLYTSQQEIENHGSPENQHVIVLLSDGMENEARYWDKSYSTLTPVSDYIIPTDTIVHTIGFGGEANQELLQDIAQRTGGNYYFIPLEEGSKNAVPTNVINLLADTYKNIEERIAKHDRLYFTTGTHSSSDTTLKMVVESGSQIEDGVISFHWAPSAKLNITVTDPAGKEITQSTTGVKIYSSGDSKAYHISKLVEGTYTSTIDSIKGSVEYIASMSGKVVKGMSMDIFFGAIPDSDYAHDMYDASFLRGLPMPIFALLTTQESAVTGATVTAQITRPDGTSNTLILYDDGDHNDGRENDGIYGNIYTRTDLASFGGVADDSTDTGMVGSYNVHVVSTKRVSKVTYTRIKDGSFQICELFKDEKQNPDPDKDGMPSRWETLYGTDPYKNDAKLDPDEDNLTNLEEFHQGTDPYNPDTDQGGESDGSEVKFERDPLNQTDDYLPQPYDVEIITDLGDEFVKDLLKENTILIRFPMNKNYKTLNVYRSETGPGADFTLINSISGDKYNGYFYDDAVTKGKTYYYKFIGVGESGEWSAPSKVVYGSSYESAEPPYGWVKINKGATLTPGDWVKLSFDANDSVYKMIYSEDPTFVGSSWIDYDKEKFHKMTNLGPHNTYTIYAQYKDKFDHFSPVYHDSIVYTADLLPTIQIKSNAKSFTGTDRMEVWAEVTNDYVPYYADLYIGAWIKPYGFIAWLTNRGWSFDLGPNAQNIEIAAEYFNKIPIITIPVTGLKKGEYSWYGFLCYPGTVTPYNFHYIDLKVN
jgi:Mg-chelatase subunit ChlD